MKNIKEINEISKDRSYLLKKSYIEALKDKDFEYLVRKLKLTEEVAMKYTSKLENTVCELNNCKKCKSILACKNKVEGYISYPTIEDNSLRFNYVSCKYKNEYDETIKNRPVMYNIPDNIKNASFKDIDLTDKKRMPLMKWVNVFLKNYQKGDKGLYLHGSFGSGKSYILAALLNELAKKQVNSIIIYYPEMLSYLKSSFNDDYLDKIDQFKKIEILLIDDIGAETVSSWSRDEVLGTILQYRMDSKLTTFFTSNLNLEELEQHLSITNTGVNYVKSKRIIERIKYLTEDMEIISENRRK